MADDAEACVRDVGAQCTSMSSDLSATESTLAEMKPIVGTSMARFLNQYNPQYDKPYKHEDNNRGQYVDRELTRVLAEERASEEAKKHNKRKDDVKSYMNEFVKFKSITRHSTTKQ
jgi:hypothetical protein